VHFFCCFFFVHKPFVVAVVLVVVVVVVVVVRVVVGAAAVMLLTASIKLRLGVVAAGHKMPMMPMMTLLVYENPGLVWVGVFECELEPG